MRCAYIDGPFGQIHARYWDAKTTANNQPALFCFHPSPFSSLAFQTIAPFLQVGRTVIAPDFPGYGGSARPHSSPSIEAYCDAMFAAVEAFAEDSEINVLGFHTGCFVAAEMAVQRPISISKICLVDVPTFPADTRADMAREFSEPVNITSDLNCLQKAWQRGYVSRLGHQSEESAFAMFTEHLRPGIHMNAGFLAAFTYLWEDRLALVQQDSLVIATQSPLLKASRAAASTLPNATLLERLDIKKSVLDGAAEPIAAEVIGFLDRAA